MSKTKEAKRVRPEPQSGLQFSEDEAAQFGKLKIIKGVTEPIMWGASRLEVTVLSKTSEVHSVQSTMSMSGPNQKGRDNCT